MDFPLLQPVLIVLLIVLLIHQGRRVLNCLRNFVSLRKSIFPRRAGISASSRGHGHSRLLKACYDMHLSPSFRGLGLSLVLALVTPAFCFAQSPFSGGAEASLAGSLPGDQVHPHLSINASGGFAVFENNHADPVRHGADSSSSGCQSTAPGRSFPRK